MNVSKWLMLRCVKMLSNTFATAGSTEKCAACMQLGADRCINYQEEDFEAELKEEGVHVILDMIGGDYVAKGLRLLHPEGRMVFINAMKGGEVSLNVLDIMRKRITLTGSTLRNRDAAFKSALATEVEKWVWPLIQAGSFTPVLFETFPLEEAAEAHRLMESSLHVGKIVLVVT